uniref:Putative secreted protein n=1 Tax=Anopheles marajoara TaxID=58244 RepID=A0A2M4CA75_9DIPT
MNSSILLLLSLTLTASFHPLSSTVNRLLLTHLKASFWELQLSFSHVKAKRSCSLAIPSSFSLCWIPRLDPLTVFFSLCNCFTTHAIIDSKAPRSRR